MLQRFDITLGGMNYIQSELALGSDLAVALLNSSELSSGKVSVFLPTILFQFFDTYNDSMLFKYEREKGREATTELWKEIKALKEKLIIEHCQSASNRCVIFETWYEKKDVSIVKEKGVSYFSYDDDIYLFLDKSTVGRDIIDHYLGTTRAYPTIVFLSSLPLEVKPLEVEDEISKNVAKLLIDRSELVLVNAYDDEGFLIWERSPENKNTL
jgi:hypothetical protein